MSGVISLALTKNRGNRMNGIVDKHLNNLYLFLIALTIMAFMAFLKMPKYGMHSSSAGTFIFNTVNGHIEKYCTSHFYSEGVDLVDINRKSQNLSESKLYKFTYNSKRVGYLEETFVDNKIAFRCYNAK